MLMVKTFVLIERNELVRSGVYLYSLGTQFCLGKRAKKLFLKLICMERLAVVD